MFMIHPLTHESDIQLHITLLYVLDSNFVWVLISALLLDFRSALSFSLPPNFVTPVGAVCNQVDQKIQGAYSNRLKDQWLAVGVQNVTLLS